MSFSLKGKVNKKYPKAIPIATVEGEKNAHMLQVHFCYYSLDHRYMWPKFKGTLEHLDEVSETVKTEYEKWVSEGTDWK